jgi:hypothetical protein
MLLRQTESWVKASADVCFIVCPGTGGVVPVNPLSLNVELLQGTGGCSLTAEKRGYASYDEKSRRCRRLFFSFVRCCAC